MVTDFRQQAAKVRDTQHCPGGSPGGDPLADQGQPRLALALYGERPPTQARSHGCPVWKALLGREHDAGLCLLVHSWHVPAKLALIYKWLRVLPIRLTDC